METFWRDIRFGIRTLRRSPGIAAVAVLSMALGIGVNATVFSYVNVLLLRPAEGIRDPDQLLAVWSMDRKGGGSTSNALPLTYPDFVYFRDHNRTFTDLLAYNGDGVSAGWSGGGDPEPIYGQLVSGNYFSLLQVGVVLGRGFLPEEARTPGTHPVLVVSHSFWQRRLRSDSEVIGKTLILNGRPFTVVGVAAEGFTGLLVGFQNDFWVPITMADRFGSRSMLESHTSHGLFVVGRMRPGVPRAQVQADLDTLARQLEQALPDTHKERGVLTVPSTALPVMMRGDVTAFIAILMGGVFLVLLIACTNAANVLMARASGRNREMAIRSAIGARRARLIRQVLTEVLLLAMLSGCAGLLLSLWVAPLLLRLTPPGLPIRLDVPLDWRVLAFTVLVSLCSGVIFGLAPALRGSRIDLTTDLKDGPLRGAASKPFARGVLVTAQMALCLVVLICSGLCLRSLWNARSVDPGFQIKNALVAPVNLRSLDYTETETRSFYDRLLARIEALPGVRSASLANHLPLGTSFLGAAVAIEGHVPPPGEPGIFIGMIRVGPKFFHTMGIAVLRGREFNALDSERDRGVVIINEAMAHRYWPNSDPIGKHFAFQEGQGGSVEVVGIVRTGKYRTLGEEPRPFMFVPFRTLPRGTIVVRTVGEPNPMIGATMRAIQELEPRLAAVQPQTLEQYMAFPLFPARAAATVLGALGFLALVLCVVGLYGVIAHSVSVRTREIGIRMALGARKMDILLEILGDGMKLTLPGIGIGIAGAFAITRILTTLLYRVSATDFLTFAFVSLLLALVALLASYIPAHKAASIDPTEALRYE